LEKALELVWNVEKALLLTAPMGMGLVQLAKVLGLV
jgi:hypothetical protein